MPDPQQTADVVATVGKGSAAAMGLFAAARVLVSLAKRLGLSEDLAAAEAKYRETLQAEMTALRARITEAEDSLRRADLESIAWQQRYAALESERDALRKELESKEPAWDPERTLPPGLR